ncbi:hypothetical protein RF11_12084 [Thelohanellus kitauei]|uniref:Uncharacterized protein n=1 Tax=Thelohanellus kitauei TaxID=669202 RepID=A0A0C2J7W5_THEKT|nr:hypothetical protein RF11_12084 [Thelohanellus kitauei]
MSLRKSVSQEMKETVVKFCIVDGKTKPRRLALSEFQEQQSGELLKIIEDTLDSKRVKRERQTSLIEVFKDRIVDLIKDGIQYSTQGLVEKLGLDVSTSTMWRLLNSLNST